MAVITKENVDMIMGNFYGLIVHWLKVVEKYPDCNLMCITLLDIVLLIQIRVVFLIYQSNNKTKNHERVNV